LLEVLLRLSAEYVHFVTAQTALIAKRQYAVVATADSVSLGPDVTLLAASWRRTAIGRRWIDNSGTRTKSLAPIASTLLLPCRDTSFAHRA
jgi:hypothetical protein